MNVPFVSSKPLEKELDAQLRSAFDRVLTNSWYIDGKDTAEVTLDKPNEGLYIANNMWREMYDFTPGTVLLVLASEYYDERDYIRNYQDFLKVVREEK